MTIPTTFPRAPIRATPRLTPSRGPRLTPSPRPAPHPSPRPAQATKLGSEHEGSTPPEPDAEFEPSVPNTVVWLMSAAMMVRTSTRTLSYAVSTRTLTTRASRAC